MKPCFLRVPNFDPPLLLLISRRSRSHLSDRSQNLAAQKLGALGPMDSTGSGVRFWAWRNLWRNPQPTGKNLATSGRL